MDESKFELKNGTQYGRYIYTVFLPNKSHHTLFCDYIKVVDGCLICVGGFRQYAGDVCEQEQALNIYAPGQWTHAQPTSCIDGVPVNFMCEEI